MGRDSFTEKALFSHFLAADDILKAIAEQTGLSVPKWNSLASLRVAHDFLYQATLALASGSTPSDVEFVEPYQTVVAKVAEFERSLTCDTHRLFQPRVLLTNSAYPEGRT